MVVEISVMVGISVKTARQFEDSANLIIREVQKEVYGNEILALKENKPLPRNSPIISLNPFLGSDEILRVGGRLKNATVYMSREKHPFIIPGKHHIEFPPSQSPW